MAGGRGTRLHPLTLTMPKPMVPIHGRPILGWIVDALRTQGFGRLWISVGYLGSQIMDHFGDGSAFGIPIRYVHEQAPLGTGGALRLLPERFERPLLVVNADVISTADYMVATTEHVNSGAMLTVLTSQRELQVPFGVASEADGVVLRIDEKPSLPLEINAGAYVVSPEALAHAPGGRFDMTDFVQRLLALGHAVRCSRLSGAWFDVGKPELLQEAQRFLEDRERRGALAGETRKSS